MFDPCLGDPCQNGGTCTNISSSDYVCNCGQGFTGLNCETVVDYCTLFNTNCNNGQCVYGIGTFTCQCNPGFTGNFCDTKLSSREDYNQASTFAYTVPNGILLLLQFLVYCYFHDNVCI